MYPVKLRQNDKVSKYRFFVVPGDGPALLGMPDTEVLGILKIICEIINGQYAGMKFNSKITQPTGILKAYSH